MKNKYVLLNRKNIVVDILSEVRYIKLQSPNSIVVACQEKEGTGVIGSDCNTHYTLIRSDMTNSEDAVRVLELEKIPSDVKPNLYKLDPETNTLVYRYSLEEAQDLKQDENKTLFAEYLSAHPLTWTDGKNYGVTLEDQSEISLNLNQYQIATSAGTENPTLEWHAIHEECQPWTVDNLVALSLSISNFVYPIYHLMQQYKTAIYSATSIEELNSVELLYNTDKEDS